MTSQWARSWVRVDLMGRDPCCPSGSKLFCSMWETNTPLSTLSKILMRWEVRATGLYCFGSDLEPPLWIGQIITSRVSAGIEPQSSDPLQRWYSGWLSCFLQDFRRAAGTPSGPAAAEEESWRHAFSMSSAVNLMSHSSSLTVSFGLKCYSKLFTFHWGRGVANTLLYCCCRALQH